MDVIDQNFASPKRKDCKLDTSSSPIVLNGRSTAIKSPPPPATTLHNSAITNGKRNHRNAGGGSKAAKKSPHQITKYFHTNGHHSSSDGSSGDSNNSIKSDTEVDANENINGTATATATAIADVKKTPVRLQNGSVLMSPEAKSLMNGSSSGSAVKQTTPHRIVIRSSPTKKQRLYVKDPVEVFSNLQIRDGTSKSGAVSASAATAAAATSRKGKQTRRKLNINDSVENQHQNGFTAAAKMSINDTEEEELGAIDDDDNDNEIDDDNDESLADKLRSSKSNDATTGKNTSKNVDKTFAVPKNTAPQVTRRVQSTQLTDYFPIRRSGRKTKKAVEQEIERHIETAIEKQLEDGLIVKMFPEKGRGIVAGRPFQRGEFVVEYIGELIDQLEADNREEAYAENAEFGCYMYYFKHKEQQWW